MRLIGHLEEESRARIFSDFLFVQGIDNQIEFSSGEGWGIWVNEEEKVAHATGLISDFRSNPTDRKYQTESSKADELRAERAKGEDAWRKRLRNRRHLFRPLTSYGFGPLTFVFIALSVVIALRSNLGADKQSIQSLFITQFMEGGSFVLPDLSLPEVRHGEIWRLFTPMFIHFGPMHILFNMLWLRDLGSMIEARQSSLHLFLLCIVISVGSNLAELYISHVPWFGGMSGVIYGLLGYIWVRGKLDPASGLYLHRTTVITMLIWLVVCFAGVVGHVANYAHLGGLIIGLAWGWISSLRHK
jgi:GlpG protein